MLSFTLGIATACTLAFGTCPAAQADSASDGCVYVVQPPYPANLWVRSGPGTQYEPIDSVPYLGTVEGSCSSHGNWTRVYGPSGCVGWSYAPYLEEVGY